MIRKRNMKEALLVSPSGEAERYNSLPDSTSDYEGVPHWEVDLTNTGYEDDGTLYIDPTIDGKEITIKKVEADGSVQEYYLDLDFPTPTLSSSDPAYSGFTESKRKFLSKKRSVSLKEGERYVNDFKKSLGNYLEKNAAALSKAKTTEDLVNLVSGAYGKGNDAYIDTVIADISSQPFSRAQYELYNILLKGRGDGVISYRR